MTEKRAGYISWDDYFMGIAVLSAHRSKDPNTQVGACIVNEDRKIVGIGYNGFPIGCTDDQLPWGSESDNPLQTKYPYVCHAEMNAIINKNQSALKGCRIYTTLFPCNECTKLIIQSGIREVIYLSDKYHDSDGCRASRCMFDMAAIEYRLFTPRTPQILIDFEKEARDVKAL